MGYIDELSKNARKYIDDKDYICPWARGSELHVLPPLDDYSDFQERVADIVPKLIETPGNICVFREKPETEDQAIVLSARGTILLMKTVMNMGYVHLKSMEDMVESLVKLRRGDICREVTMPMGATQMLITVQSNHYTGTHARKFPSLALGITDESVIGSVIAKQRQRTDDVIHRAQELSGAKYSTSDFFVRQDNTTDPYVGPIMRKKQAR